MKRLQFETDTRFLLDTAFHRLEIIRDDGLYRHLRMQQPGTSCYYYDVITWPGYLTVTGDMGTWTFSRIADMFSFFGGWTGEINTGYWSEKLEAGAGRSAHDLLAQEYNHDAFCASLMEWFSEYVTDDEEEEPDADWDDDNDEPDSDKARIREIVRDLCRDDFRNDVLAHNAVYEADWPECVDTWELCADLTYKTYSTHFRWILFAITWAISKYHNAKLVDKAMGTFLAVKGAK
ncbi:hypothetical protein SH579_06995 [Raoultella ornithinolytica]|uniref:hypothetical protein n=1 Tax=Raoultella ornithinolytica TaxID=54291 RepID=UPI002A5A0A26|nr:hypothetical protein [Raoultella ornithinolytica]WPO20668.1 hypothetical protein SH579_06995 [Raoultella ornithinolytica]